MDKCQQSRQMIHRCAPGMTDCHCNLDCSLIPFAALAGYISSTQSRRQFMSTIIRNALVTGATSGIGQAIAETLAARGVRVVVSGRDAARGNEVVKTIRARGGDARFLAADLATAAAATDLAKASEKLLGGVDILVNNAGIF